MRDDLQPDYLQYFIPALCAEEIPLDQRESFAQFLCLIEINGDWTPLETFLDFRGPFFEFTKLLSILVQPDGFVFDAENAQKLMRYLPALQMVYSGTTPSEFQFEDDIVRNAIEGVLRLGISAFEAPWNDVEIHEIFQVFWDLLNGPRKLCECADDFFNCYIDSDKVLEDEENEIEPEPDIIAVQLHIYSIMNQYPVMRRLCEERITGMEQFDLAAVKLLGPLDIAADETLLRKLSVGSDDPVWKFYVFSFLSTKTIPISDEMFHAMLSNHEWIDSMVAITVIENISEELLPAPEILAHAVLSGFAIVEVFQTEMVVSWLDHFDHLLWSVLKRETARIALIPIFPQCMELAWSHMERHSPRFTLHMARLLCRFIRFPEFSEFIRGTIIEPFTRMIHWNHNHGFDFASKLAFAASGVLEQMDDVIQVLRSELENRLKRHDWSNAVCEIALYFVVNGENGFERPILRQMERYLLSSGSPLFLSLVVAVLQRSSSRTILDFLMDLSRRLPDFRISDAFFIAASILYLGGHEINVEHVNQVVGFCFQNGKKFKPNMVRDRLLLAFLCRLLTIDMKGQETTRQWQNVFRLSMTILGMFATDAGLVGSARPFCKPLKHHQILCGGFLWVFEEWNSYVRTLVQGLELPTVIAMKLDQVKD